MATAKKAAPVSKRAQQLREEHAAAVRERIQTSSLLNVLHDYALGNKNVKMTGTRLKAIEMLLDKSLPNLASIKHEVDQKQVVFMIDTTFPDEQPDDQVPTAG